MSRSERTRARILLVDDDPGLTAMLRDRLEARGYEVWRAETAAEAEALADELRPDLFILDLMLPDMHGLVLCANLREKSLAPIIICSGTKRKDDLQLGFKLGAIDFIAKPFSVGELEARVETALLRPRADRRRLSPAGKLDEALMRLGPLVIDRPRRRVMVGDSPVRCTPTEYQLLCLLAARPNTVVSREELAGAVWGTYDLGIRRSLEVHLRRLRAKLGGSTSGPMLVAVRGFGYQLLWEPDLLDAVAGS
jgi:DNA-binding response OmpR family regulator